MSRPVPGSDVGVALTSRGSHGEGAAGAVEGAAAAAEASASPPPHSPRLQVLHLLSCVAGYSKAAMFVAFMIDLFCVRLFAPCRAVLHRAVPHRAFLRRFDRCCAVLIINAWPHRSSFSPAGQDGGTEAPVVAKSNADFRSMLGIK